MVRYEKPYFDAEYFGIIFILLFTGELCRVQGLGIQQHSQLQRILPAEPVVNRSHSEGLQYALLI